MNTQRLLAVVVIGIGYGASSLRAAPCASPSPNFVVILTDDQSWLGTDPASSTMKNKLNNEEIGTKCANDYNSVQPVCWSW